MVSSKKVKVSQKRCLGTSIESLLALLAEWTDYILLFHLVNRAFLKGATNFSMNKSVNFEGSYDHSKATKF